MFCLRYNRGGYSQSGRSNNESRSGWFNGKGKYIDGWREMCKFFERGSSI
jgi:hypothetical protein